MCLPRLNPATEVDHINEDATDDRLENLQGLCKSCHTKKTNSFRSVVPDISDSGANVVLVCGPPGSGKTTWAMDQLTDRDVLIDFDIIKSELSGIHGRISYDVGNEWIKPAIIERERRIRAIPDLTDAVAYVTLAMSSPQVRAEWAEKLGAKIKMMETSASECKRRIMADSRRPRDVKIRHCQIVDGWY